LPRGLARTVLVSLAPAAVFAVAWLRLESPVDRPLDVVVVIALALLPALVRPLAARIVSALAMAVLGAWLAYGLAPWHPLHFLGTLGSRFSNGFLDFYDVKTPFDARVYADMRAVVLTAIFAFALACAVAVAERRAVAALLVLLVGAGWPATLTGPSGGLVVGALILLAALAVLAGLSLRTLPRAVVPVAGALLAAALAASTSAAVAKGGIVRWQRWNVHALVAPVSVSFVWDGQYAGLHWPRKRTTVLEVKAPKRSLFWRAAVLDDFSGTQWYEGAPLNGDALEPASLHPVRQDVRILALADTRLVGASVPVRYDAGDAPIVTEPGAASLPSGLTYGFEYTVWSDAPQPTAAQLERSKPRYPTELIEPDTFLDVEPGVTMPPFGRPRHTTSPIGRLALRVAAGARTPYAAAAALESWFRRTGGFTYTDTPPSASLASFILHTRAGYCQHFAGAMALMLRYLGVPARVAVGFSSGAYDAKSGTWRVTDHDAHAWVEAWFRGYGWLPFDPTPAARPERGELSAPYALPTAATGGAGPAGPKHRGVGISVAVQVAHRHGETPNARSAATPAVRSRHVPAPHGSLLGLLALVLAGVAAAIALAKLAVRARRYATRDPRRVAAACRQELSDYLVDQRVDAARSATLHELGALLVRELAVEADAFVAAASAARFGPPAQAAASARAARRELRLVVRGLRRRLRVRDRVRGTLSLRSLGLTA